jgi:hypothetical protein
MALASNNNIKGSSKGPRRMGMGGGLNGDPIRIMQTMHETDLNKHWLRPPQQPVEMEILQSSERPNMTATFGTSTPPSGLSGRIRRFAFRYSESSRAHWLPLMLADRINMLEGLVQDLSRGHVPNIFAEMGIRSEIRHNPRGFALKAGVAAGATYLLITWMKRRKHQRLG